MMAAGRVSAWLSTSASPTCRSRSTAMRLERRELAVPEWTRVTTTIVMRGRGLEGRGEDVTYQVEEHDALAAADPGRPVRRHHLRRGGRRARRVRRRLPALGVRVGRARPGAEAGLDDARRRARAAVPAGAVLHVDPPGRAALDGRHARPRVQARPGAGLGRRLHRRARRERAHPRARPEGALPRSRSSASAPTSGSTSPAATGSTTTRRSRTPGSRTAGSTCSAATSTASRSTRSSTRSTTSRRCRSARGG